MERPVLGRELRITGLINLVSSSGRRRIHSIQNEIYPTITPNSTSLSSGSSVNINFMHLSYCYFTFYK
jgi:hypothetical protein